MPSGTTGTSPDYVTLEEAAARTGLTIWTVRREVRETNRFCSVVPVIRLGQRKAVLPRAKFEAFLAGDLPQGQAS